MHVRGRIGNGDPAEEPRETRAVIPLVYEELRALSRRFLAKERPNHTLQPTALAHEVFLRLAAQRKDSWSGRDEFFGAAATMIRRILVNHEKGRRALKRGGGATLRSLDHEPAVSPRTLDLIALDELLDQLAELDPRQARIVELRFFGGLSLEDTARVMGLSARTIGGEWALARAWLRAGLGEEDLA